MSSIESPVRMRGENGGATEGRWRLNMRLLRWVAIVLPVLFLASFDAVRQTVFSGQPHTLPGFIGLYVLVAVAVVIFAYTLFGFIGRLQRRIMEQNLQLSALDSIARAAASKLLLDELLATSLDHTLPVMKADAGLVYLLNGDQREYPTVCSRGFSAEMVRRIQQATMGGDSTGQQGVPSDRPKDIERVLDDPGVALAAGAEGIKSVIIAPLKAEEEVNGILVIATRSGSRQFTPVDEETLKGIGEWLALAIENARLYQQVQDMAVLQERDRIAREMHDGMAQLLGYVNAQTIAVKRLLLNRQLKEAQEELTKMEEIARDLYADVREGILGLRSAVGRQEDLLAALREYTERYMEMSGLDVEINVSPEAEGFQLAPSIEIQLMRIVQEALTNVRKHSRATAATLTFEHDGDKLRVAIADNGQGFDVERLPSTGRPRFGLQTMRERAEALDGTFSIDAAPGRGTTVELHIPLIPARTLRA